MNKFRAWDSELKFFVDPTVYFVGLDGSAWFNNCENGEDDMIDQSFKLVIEHNTGIKDKTGQYIYEGDILDFDEKEWGGEFTPEVITMENIIGEWGYCGTLSDVGEFRKVIGNIHETPKLLPAV